MGEAGTFHRVTIGIAGLGPEGGGALTAERVLSRAPGVVRAYVNPLTEMAYVEFDPMTTSTATLAAAIEMAGFQAAEVRRL